MQRRLPFGFLCTKEQFVRSLTYRKYLFLLDGLDEVTDARMGRLRESIKDLSERHHLSQIIVSSRSLEDEFRSWHTFTVADTVRLNKQQALSLIKRLEYGPEAKERFAEQLDSHLYSQHKSFASNPLLLTMMLVFSHKASIPNSLKTFYQQAFETLLREHDATKEGLFRRSLFCGLPDDEFEHVFSHFCFTTFMRDQFAFSRHDALDRIRAAKDRIFQTTGGSFDSSDYLRDLTESVCMLQRDGLSYSFVHRSFQEYFAALYTMNLDDDNKVHQVVTRWLEGHVGAFTNSSVFFRALPSLNYDRFVRHVALRPLCDLRDKCLASENPDYAFLESIYESMMLDLFETDNGDVEEGIVLIVIEGPLQALVDWLKFDCEAYRIAYTARVSDKEAAPKSRTALFDYLAGKLGREVTLAEAREDGMVDAILGYWQNEAQQFFAAVDLFERRYATNRDVSPFDDIDAL